MPTDPITALANRLDTLPLAVQQGLVGAVQTFGEQLLDYNRNYLARQGEKPDGEPISPGGYSPAYAAYKKKYGRFTNTAFVDLKLSGSFAAGFRLDYLGGLRFEILNTDSKAARLLESYGDLYGVREADIEDYISTYLLPEVRQLIIHHMSF